MIRQSVVAASIALLGISGQAMAAQTAQLGSVSGSVLVNQNGRFAPVTEATQLRAGDRVLAMNGAAKLTYADGCAVDVAPRSMVTVSDAACGGEQAKLIRAQYTDADNDGYYEAGSNADLWLWIGFGILTAAVVIAAWDDDESPVSP